MQRLLFLESEEDYVFLTGPNQIDASIVYEDNPYQDQFGSVEKIIQERLETDEYVILFNHENKEVINTYGAGDIKLINHISH